MLRPQLYGVAGSGNCTGSLQVLLLLPPKGRHVRIPSRPSQHIQKLTPSPSPLFWPESLGRAGHRTQPSKVRFRRREEKYSKYLLDRFLGRAFTVQNVHHTRVVHFEIPADNEERAKTFYQKAFGWDISKYPGMEYHMVGTTEVDQKTRQPTAPGAINGGLTKRKSEVKNTVITVDVADIEATLKNVEKLGGKTVRKKEPVTDMGFTAYFKDTEGNIVGLWQSARRM